MNAAEIHRRATEEFGRRVTAIGEDQWGDPTPCTEWDVRTLVNHLVSEQIWIAPLVADGLTVAAVGDRFSGDLLGGDPKAAWESAAKEAVMSFSAPGALTRTVHLTGRDATGERYAHEVFCDLAVHSWDLAKGMGADDEIDPALVEAVWEIGVPMVREWRKLTGDSLFAGEQEVAEGADLQTKLLAHYGRRRDWKP